MVWFYRLDKEEIVNTRTDIPQEDWEKKNILPYRKQATEIQENVGLVIGDSEVVDYYYKAPIPEKTLEEVKEIKKQEIKNILFDILKEGFILSSGIKLDCMQNNINDFANAKQLLDNSGATEITIRDYDNKTHTLSASDYTNLVLELGNYYQTKLSEKWAYQDLIDNYATKEEVEAFYWRKPVLDEEQLNVVGYTYWGE